MPWVPFWAISRICPAWEAQSDTDSWNLESSPMVNNRCPTGLLTSPAGR